MLGQDNQHYHLLRHPLFANSSIGLTHGFLIGVAMDLLLYNLKEAPLSVLIFTTVMFSLIGWIQGMAKEHAAEVAKLRALGMHV